MKKFICTALLISVLAFVLFASATEATEAVSDLTPWQGVNLPMTALFTGENGDMLFTEIAKYAKGYDKDMVREYFNDMYYTKFEKFEVVDGNTVVYDGSNEVSYFYVGKLDTTWGEYSISWHIFKSNDEYALNNGYKYLLMMPYHGHGEGMAHCHMRYGNENFDFLSTDPSVQNSWPTLYQPENTDEEKAVFDMMKTAKMQATMLPALK